MAFLKLAGAGFARLNGGSAFGGNLTLFLSIKSSGGSYYSLRIFLAGAGFEPAAFRL